MFKTLTGETPITHLNRLRVRQAEHQLRASRRGITGIASACGFNSSQDFARVFKAFTGREARSYRLSK